MEQKGHNMLTCRQGCQTRKSHIPCLSRRGEICMHQPASLCRPYLLLHIWIYITWKMYSYMLKLLQPLELCRKSTWTSRLYWWRIITKVTSTINQVFWVVYGKIVQSVVSDINNLKTSHYVYPWKKTLTPSQTFKNIGHPTLPMLKHFLFK